MHPQDQPSFFDRLMLNAEASELRASLAAALDRVVHWSEHPRAHSDLLLEHELMDVRYYATCLRTVERLLEAQQE